MCTWRSSPAWVQAAEITLVDPTTRRSLEACNWTAARIVGSGVLPDAPEDAESPTAADLRARARDLRDDLAALRPAVGEVDPLLVPLLRRAARDSGDALYGLAEKIERVERNRRGGGRRHRRRVESSLLPLGEAQQRVLGPLHLLARWDRAWVDGLLEVLPAISTGPALASFDESSP